MLYCTKIAHVNRRNTHSMNNKFIASILNIIEHVTKSELNNTSRQLILRYLENADAFKHADKARQVIRRYTQNDIPSLEAIRDKSKKQELNALDHLVLKMEYESRKLDEM
jgi:hypothetical protein